VCAPTGTCERTSIDAHPGDAPGSIDAAIDGARDAAPDARMLDAAPDTAVPHVTWRATTTQIEMTSANATSITIATPTYVAGDVLIAVLAVGRSGVTTAPVLTPPGGWTLVRATAHSLDTVLAVYWHVAATVEPASYTFAFNQALEGAAWISSYAGVSPTAPVETDDAIVITTASTTFDAPTLTTTTANTMLVASYATHDAGTMVTWTLPIAASARADLYDGTTRSALGLDEPFAGPGTTPALTATASSTQQFGLIHVMALRTP
jgi:hypothetical protein